MYMCVCVCLFTILANLKLAAPGQHCGHTASPLRRWEPLYMGNAYSQPQELFSLGVCVCDLLIF